MVPNELCETETGRAVRFHDKIEVWEIAGEGPFRKYEEWPHVDGHQPKADGMEYARIARPRAMSLAKELGFLRPPRTREGPDLIGG